MAHRDTSRRDRGRSLCYDPAPPLRRGRMETAPARPLSPDTKRWAVAQLRGAYESRVPVAPLTGTVPDLTGPQAYEVQLALLDEWVKAGARVVGKKIGLTSLAAQKHFNVFEPDYGHLTDTMSRPEDSIIDLGELIQPKI